jgi:hypothetical protein
MQVMFVVTGMNFDPHEITRHFGFDPTEVLIKGQSRLGKRPRVPHSSWSVDTKWARFDSTDAALKPLLEIIWPHRKQVRDFVAKNKLQITFVLNMRDGGNRNFLYEFSPRTLKRISYFEAPLYLDAY